MATDTENALFVGSIVVAVTNCIGDLQRHGGPEPGDYAKLKTFSTMLAEEPNRILCLQYGGKAVGLKKGETAQVFAQVAHVIAVLSFHPGGITIFGSHFEAKVEKVEEVRS